MNNFDLVGEMSLEQFEHNIESLHGKEKATELADILRHTKVDPSIKNKFYASVFNRIQSQNSIDSVLKNPTQIISSAEKDLMQFEKMQQENLNIENPKLYESTSFDYQKLIVNPQFIQSPINYIYNLAEDERKEFLVQTLGNHYTPDEIQTFSNILDAVNSYVTTNDIDKDSQTSDTLEEKTADSKDVESNDSNTTINSNDLLAKTIYEPFIKMFPELKSNSDFFHSPPNVANFLDALLFTLSNNNEKDLANITREELLQTCKARQVNYPNTKFIVDNLLETLQSERFKENSIDQIDELYNFHNNFHFRNQKKVDLQPDVIDQARQQFDFDDTITSEQEDIETFCYEAMQQAYDPYSFEQEHELKNDENFDINIIGTFDEQTELLQQILDSNAEPQQDIPQQSVPIGTVEYIQQQMQEQKALEELEQSEKASNTPEKPDFAKSSETNDNSYLVEVNEKKSFFQTIKSGVSNFFKRINQKSLPNPNESKAKHTNMSLDDYDRKASFMSAIRSFGDKITNATKAITNLSKANKQPLNTPASMDYQNNSGQNLDISGNPSSANTKKDFIKPKAVETVAKSQPRESHTNFDKFIKVNNAGNKIEQAAMSTKKTPNTTNISQTKSNGQLHDDNDEQQFVE